MDIDFVIPWVDGNDPEWRYRFLKYKSLNGNKDAARFRDWNILKYWFRAVEKYAPWVHKIYFITSGELPEWMNLNASEKLVHIKHEDYIPAKYLPTFSANTIELNMHRIPGLAEHFVYFNDDEFLNREVEPTNFFRNGLPCDAPQESLFGSAYYSRRDRWGISVMDFCNVMVLNKHFNRNKTIKDSPYRWLGGYMQLRYIIMALLLFQQSNFHHFRMEHQAQPFLRSALQNAWEEESEWLDKSCTYKFRQDLSLNQYFFRYWQLAQNRFPPPTHTHTHRLKCKQHMSISNSTTIQQIDSLLFDEKLKLICLNDTPYLDESSFMRLQPLLEASFQRKLPEKSIFEW